MVTKVELNVGERQENEKAYVGSESNRDNLIAVPSRAQGMPKTYGMVRD